MNNIVKLYGLNHSGSHYLAWLLHNNFQNMVILHSHTGWNHGKIRTVFHWDSTKWNSDPYFTGNRERHGQLLKSESLNSGRPVTDYEHEIEVLYNKRILPIFVLIRNPHDWLRSYNIKHNPKSVPWKSLESSCKLWSEINLNYIETEWNKKHIIKYEHLRDDTTNQLDLISDFLNIDRNTEFKDTQSDAVMLNRTNYSIGFENINGKDRSVREHEKKFGISPQEYDKIFEENIDPKVLEFYNNL